MPRGENLRVAICSVGSELVMGHVADSNAAWLARRVAETDGSVSAMLVVGDDRDRLVEALRWLAERCDVLVVGGGLGPTFDDLTRDAVADFAGVGLERHDELVVHLERVYERLGRTMPVEALRQADVPATAEVHTPRGTAAGFSLDAACGGDVVRVHVLPGVPWEYRELAERVVLPEVVRLSGGSVRITRTLRVTGLGESGVGEALRPVVDRVSEARNRPEAPEHWVELGLLANEDEVLVRLSVTGPDPETARNRAEPLLREAAELLGEAVTSVDDRRLEEEVGQLIVSSDVSVATVETFTGGRLAATLSSVSSASAHLRGGYVVRTPAMRRDILGDAGRMSPEAGAAGRQTAEALSRAVQRRAGADFAIAVVGVGDDCEPTRHLPAGTATSGVARPDGSVHVEERILPAADREMRRAQGVAFALGSLRGQLAAWRSQASAGS
ncbi:molybdopterin-binding protein [Qaidamihabitans albus]|uniref:molybdopterin-binding protein n=1 Tax=Qaidamihabitans albus TaxID=2795733 RepID=UPI0018F13142|nr:molybdopterin-binding protein [Qaidamihabitans albus]